MASVYLGQFHQSEGPEEISVVQESAPAQSFIQGMAIHSTLIETKVL